MKSINLSFVIVVLLSTYSIKHKSMSINTKKHTLSRPTSRSFATEYLEKNSITPTNLSFHPYFTPRAAKVRIIQESDIPCRLGDLKTVADNSDGSNKTIVPNDTSTPRLLPETGFETTISNTTDIPIKKENQLLQEFTTPLMNSSTDSIICSSPCEERERRRAGRAGRKLRYLKFEYPNIQLQMDECMRLLNGYQCFERKAMCMRHQLVDNIRSLLIDCHSQDLDESMIENIETYCNEVFETINYR